YLWSDNQAAMQKEQANSSSPAPSATPSQQQPNELGWHVLVDQQTEPPPPPPPPPAPPAAPGRAPGAAPVGEPSPEPPRTLIGMTREDIERVERYLPKGAAIYTYPVG